MRPVVLVHGFASSFARNWVEPGVVELLRDVGREVVGVDLLGHGDAPRPHDPASYADLGTRVRAVLPAEPVDALGFSLGAQVLLELALDEPARFRRLVLAGVGASVFRHDDPEPLATAIETGTAPGDHPVAQAFTRFASAHGNDPAALAACLRRPRRTITPDDLASLPVPVVVVTGDRDFAGPAEPLVDALPDATLVTLRGVDHLATPTDFGFLDAVLSTLADP